MARKILGLDLGTNSIGWAVVNEAENANEQSSIVKLGVRVNPLTVDEQQNFEKGKSIPTNAERTLKRSMRRNLQRYKLRRENLIELLQQHGFISDNSILTENGNRTTFETYCLRAKAATEEVSLEEFARILLMINKKRGYKSNRKVKNNDDGKLIDGISIAKQLYENDLTPGQFVLGLLQNGEKQLPDFYRSDLQTEFDKIWTFQKQFYPEILTDELHDKLKNKNEKQTWAICVQPFGIEGIKREAKGEELKHENYEWRAKSLEEKMDLEKLAIVLQKVNAQINNSSGYLGAISDRSKELFFRGQTVGQYQMAELAKNPNYSLKNQVFYRQDYLDEFEKIWETQAQYHKELTQDLKKEIRDIVIFYQRPLKSQKGLISFCEFESRQIEVEIDGKKKIKTIGSRVCPKSSPLFQEFKIWQTLNNIQVSGKVISKETSDLFGSEKSYEEGKRFLNQEEKEILFTELNLREKLSKTDALKLLYKKGKGFDLNHEEIDGNKTNATLFKAYQTIIELSGYDGHDFSKMRANEIEQCVESTFKKLGYNTDILHFDALLDGDNFKRQPAYQLWHLIYSFEGDSSKLGNDKLIEKISQLYNFDRASATILANVAFQPDYGNLSTKAMRKILPYMEKGDTYSVACEKAGYRHSKRSLTKEELEHKVLKDHLELLPRNSLRNPVVEKILNQMIHVVNSVIDTYGKPDEIRIELARELKKSAKEREEMTRAINKTTAEHEKYRTILQEEFGIKKPTKNDIIRYKLYLELGTNDYKTLYSNTYIPREKLFSKEFDIEHIIPQARLFDNSLSNKTIESRSVNIDKGNTTAFDYVSQKYGESGIEEYKMRIENLYKNNIIGKTKYKNLLMSEADIPNDFIERDLRDSQYIAKKAREILETIVKVVVPTTGSVTARLREDWQLVDVMKELNFPKYAKLGLVENEEHIDYATGEIRYVKKIKDWTKRNDHRHHAMDALTIAFTKSSFIQYLNNLNARVQKSVDDYIDLDYVEISTLSKKDREKVIYGIERKELEPDKKGKLRFKSPIPLDKFRAEAKRQLENILVSTKAKNKVVTRNINTIQKHGTNQKVTQLTPRGQLHNETVYGKIKRYAVKMEKIGSAFDNEKIATVTCKQYRDALLHRLAQFEGNSTKAFTGKNSLEKNPIFLNEEHTEQVPDRVKTVAFEYIYTIRKDVSYENFGKSGNKKLNADGVQRKLGKVIDTKIRKILERRLAEFGGDAQKAFSNLDENPIWLNKEKGIQIKRVTISGVSDAEALHEKHDHFGSVILNADGKTLPSDFVQTGNNHHVAIYRDAQGNLQENVVSFYEATTRATLGLPIIDKEYKKDEGWQFLFTMKQNEYFVFPNKETGFDPNEIDLQNPDNYAIISPNLFRVQKIATKNYMFRHHLETVVGEKKELRRIAWELIQTPQNLQGIVKVRVNHIGQIVDVGEY